MNSNSSLFEQKMKTEDANNQKQQIEKKKLNNFDLKKDKPSNSS